jgi:hypothetical protein
MRSIALGVLGLLVVAAPPRPAMGASAGAADKDAPSRPAGKGCAWERLADAKLGLEAWVQRCDYGFRKIDLFVKDASIVERYSDGGEPERLIDVLDLLPDEKPEAGLRRIFAAHTDAAVARRCVLKPYKQGKPVPGAQHFTFVPDAAFQKELDAHRSDGVPDPACGEWGDAPDSIQYFEVQPASGARKVLFVRVGQDEPPFDERSLHLITSH